MFRKFVFKTPKVILLIAIKIYQKICSPWLGNCCRFHPSCSNYAKTAIKHYGFLGGLYFTLRRLLRCHPFHQGGYDPVPQKKKRHDH